MAIKTINKLDTRDEGFSNPVDCPECKINTPMKIIAAIDKSIVGKIKKEDKDTVVAVCPRCASVFTLSKNYYNERANGTTVTMTESDLNLLVRGKNDL